MRSDISLNFSICINYSVLFIGSSWKNRWGTRLHHYRRPSDVKPREERRPSINEIAQQKHVMQKVNGWKLHYLTAQIEDIAEIQKQVRMDKDNFMYNIES